MTVEGAGMKFGRTSADEDKKGAGMRRPDLF
jgi:hypothetical protein